MQIIDTYYGPFKNDVTDVEVRGVFAFSDKK